MSSIPSQYSSQINIEIPHKSYHSLTLDCSLTQETELQEDESKRKNVITVTMELKSNENSERLSVIYDSFFDETQFCNLMQWQLHLVQNHFNEG